MSNAKYKRVLIKLSGEALSGNKGFGLDDDMIAQVCTKIKELVDMGVQVGIVVGGGNFWRGRQRGEMDRATADYIGMMATVMNALAIQDAVERAGAKAVIHSALEVPKVAKVHVIRDAVSALEEGKVVIFSGGTGSPYFTTDTTAALRAAEIEADVILLAKNVDGVYDSDPKDNPNAKRFDEISYIDVINKNLGVMDLTAITLCMDNKIEINVFGLKEAQNIVDVALGNMVGTVIK